MDDEQQSSLDLDARGFGEQLIADAARFMWNQRIIG